MTNKQFSRRTKFMSQKQWLYEAVRGKIQKSSYVVIRYVSGGITRSVSRVRIETDAGLPL